MDHNNNEKIISEMLVQSLEEGTLEDFWETVNTLLSIATASVAYRFGEDLREQAVEHMVAIVLDTYDSEKSYHDKDGHGSKPKLH